MTRLQKIMLLIEDIFNSSNFNIATCSSDNVDISRFYINLNNLH